MRNISKRKEGDRDLVYYSATTRAGRYYAITMHFKRKVIVFSSSSSRVLHTLSIVNILKQFVWETHKWHYNFRRNGSWVIDHNNILQVLINNSRTAWPTKILMQILSFSDNNLSMQLQETPNEKHTLRPTYKRIHQRNVFKIIIFLIISSLFLSSSFKMIDYYLNIIYFTLFL